MIGIIHAASCRLAGVALATFGNNWSIYGIVLCTVKDDQLSCEQM